VAWGIAQWPRAPFGTRPSLGREAHSLPGIPAHPWGSRAAGPLGTLAGIDGPSMNLRHRLCAQDQVFRHQQALAPRSLPGLFYG
jgi:hypothetical protein